MRPDDSDVLSEIEHLEDELDPSQSLITQPRKNLYLEQVRVSSPQKTIDQLLIRKNFYKKISKEQSAIIEQLKEKARTQEIRERKIREMNKSLEKTARDFKDSAKMWRNNAVACFVIILLIVAIVFCTNLPNRTKVEMSGKQQATPNYVLASVNIYNGKLQGSGTIISKGDKYAYLVSAAHNFLGKINGEFWVYYPDGTYTKATLVAIDRERDLALARVDADTVLAKANVPKELIKGDLYGVGYFQNQGPNLRRLTYTGTSKNEANKFVWGMQSTNGDYAAGGSGSGVFVNGELVGVGTHREAGNSSKKIYVVSHHELLDFLKINAPVGPEFGDWTHKEEEKVAAIDAPPLWQPTPNIPINTQNGVEKMIYDLKQELASFKQKVNDVDTSVVPVRSEEEVVTQEIPYPSAFDDVIPKIAKDKDFLKKPSEVK